MEIPRYWRLQKQFKQFTGHSRVNGKGVEVSFDGKHWTPSSNERHKNENPCEAKTIFTPEEVPGGNGKQPIRGSIEVTAATD